MSIWRGAAIAALALAAGAWAERAHADEAYVCEAGRVAYVKPGELEEKKRTDPCVARYFDDIPSVKRASSAARPATDQKAATPVAEEPLPVQKVSTAAPAAKTVPVRISTAEDAAGSTFRKVRIINAAPGEEAWFHHRH